MEQVRQRTSIWFYFWSVILILGCIWAFLQMNHPFAERARQQLESTFDRSIHWSALSDWYRSLVDSSPVITPPNVPVTRDQGQHVNGQMIDFLAPLSGNVWLSFSVARQGMTIQSSESVVTCIADGRVIYNDFMTGIGRTVIVQHANGYQSWYGLLEQAAVEKNDWLAAGEKIGEATKVQEQSTFFVFIALKSGEKFINPLDVMRID